MTLSEACKAWIATKFGSGGCYVASGLSWVYRGTDGVDYSETNGATAQIVSRLVSALVVSVTYNSVTYVYADIKAANGGSDVLLADAKWVADHDGSPAGEAQYCTATPTPTPAPFAFIIGGRTNNTSWSDKFAATKITPSVTGYVNQLSLEVANLNAGGSARMALYADSSGRPGTLLTQSSSKALVSGWNNFSIPPTQIINGTVYWVVFNKTGDSSMYYTGIGAVLYYASMAYDAFPATAPTGGGIDSSAWSLQYSGTVGSVATPTPTPAPTTTPTPTPGPTGTPTPVPSAVWHILQAVDSANNTLSSAKIDLDGTYTGHYTPENLAVAPGSHTVRVYKPGYTDWSKTRTFAAGDDISDTPTLPVAPSPTPTPVPTIPPNSTPSPSTSRIGEFTFSTPTPTPTPAPTLPPLPQIVLNLADITMRQASDLHFEINTLKIGNVTPATIYIAVEIRLFQGSKTSCPTSGEVFKGADRVDSNDPAKRVPRIYTLNMNDLATLNTDFFQPTNISGLHTVCIYIHGAYTKADLDTEMNNIPG